MRITVLAKTKSREEKIEKVDEWTYRVWVKEPPVKGRANDAIIAILADYFNTISLNIRIISGLSAKTKIIEILSDSSSEKL